MGQFAQFEFETKTKSCTQASPPRPNGEAEDLYKHNSDDKCVEEFQSRPVITQGPVLQRHAGFHVAVSCSLRYNLFLFICVDKYWAAERQI